MSSYRVCATTAIMVKGFLSAFRMTFFPDFETADFFAFVSRDISFICGSVSKNCELPSLSKRLLKNSSWALLPIFWALQRSIMASSKGDAPVEILDSSCGSKENGFCQASLRISVSDLTSPSSLFVLEGLRSGWFKSSCCISATCLIILTQDDRYSDVI